MENIVQKRYRFNLDLNDPAQKSLNGFLELLDSMTIKERGAWLSRALTFYHDAIISGAVEPENQSQAHQMLMAQTLAYQYKYSPENPISQSVDAGLSPLVLSRSYDSQQDETSKSAQNGTNSASNTPFSVDTSAISNTSTVEDAVRKDTPMKRRLGAIM